MPTWSHDGQWIYFSADEGSGRNVWRMAAAGGPHQQMTRDGSGLFACESPDGKSIMYQADIFGDSPLQALPIAGGPVRQLVKCVQNSAFGVSGASIYYGACSSGPGAAVHQFDPVTNRDRILGSVEEGFGLNRLVISPDGKTILIQRQTASSDLMMIENFR